MQRGTRGNPPCRPATQAPAAGRTVEPSQLCPVVAPYLLSPRPPWSTAAQEWWHSFMGSAQIPPPTSHEGDVLRQMQKAWQWVWMGLDAFLGDVSKATSTTDHCLPFCSFISLCSCSWETQNIVKSQLDPRQVKNQSSHLCLPIQYFFKHFQLSHRPPWAVPLHVDGKCPAGRN